MVIITTELTGLGQEHELKQLVERKHREDFYVLCSCGYQGPSRVDRAESMNDLAVHAAAATPAPIRWRVTLQSSHHGAQGIGGGIVIANEDPETWRFAAEEQEKIEEGRAELARVVQAQGVFVADVSGTFTKIKGVKSFNLTHAPLNEHRLPNINADGTISVGVVEFNRFSSPCTTFKTVCGGAGPTRCLLASADHSRCPR